MAWDCGTGSGQAARALAAYFERVVATDASPEQLAHATAHPRIEYRVSWAHRSGLAAGSADVVTVAQALHWFDLEPFYREVHRVLAPGGALAVWCYSDPSLDDPALDAALRRFSRDTVEPYWHPGRRAVREGYQGLPFPFAEAPGLTLTLERDWTLPEFLGYVRTWSAVGRYVAARGIDPVPALEAELTPGWGDPAAPHRVRWPLTVRAGIVT